MRISNLPWGVFHHRGHTRDAYVDWFRFTAADPNIDAVDLIDGGRSMFGLPERREESRALKAMLDDLALPVMMFVSHADFRVDELGAEEKDRLDYLIEQAVFFRAEVFRTITGLRTPGELFGEGIMENVIDGLRWLGTRVRDAGLPFVIEDHHETTDEMVLLCERLSDVDLHLNCEIKPAFRYHMDPYEYVRRLAPYSTSYHLDNFRYDESTEHWDKDRAGRKLGRAVPLDAGEIDVGRVLSIVKSSGFDGWLNIEYGGLVDGFEDVSRSAEFVRTTWDAL